MFFFVCRGGKIETRVKNTGAMGAKSKSTLFSVSHLALYLSLPKTKKKKKTTNKTHWFHNILLSLYSCFLICNSSTSYH